MYIIISAESAAPGDFPRALGERPERKPAKACGFTAQAV